jgi:hypothetical protein
MSTAHLLGSGFVRHDYILTFSIADAPTRARLVALCQGPWNGDEVSACTWEVSNDLSPHDLEVALAEVMASGDRVTYYYLSTSKRIFRVALFG